MVSETGGYCNNIAVFSLAMAATGPDLVVSGVMLARAIPAVLAGPAVIGVLSVSIGVHLWLRLEPLPGRTW